MQKYVVKVDINSQKNCAQNKPLQKQIVKKTVRKIKRCKNFLQTFLYIC